MENRRIWQLRLDNGVLLKAFSLRMLEDIIHYRLALSPSEPMNAYFGGSLVVSLKGSTIVSEKGSTLIVRVGNTKPDLNSLYEASRGQKPLSEEVDVQLEKS